MATDIVIQLRELASSMERGEGMSTVYGAATEIELLRSLNTTLEMLKSGRDVWRTLAETYSEKIEEMRMLAKEDSLALQKKDEEIRELRKLAMDWEDVAKTLATDLGKVEYASAVYEDIRDGLYQKVRSRLSTGANNYAQDGVVKAVNVVPQELIKNYLNKYRGFYGSHTDQSSYLPSRDEYKNSKEIIDILNCDAIKKLVALAGPGFEPMLAEARLISSEIYWHRDCNLNDKESGDRYMGVIIALEDSQDGCGDFEYIPGSHLWDVDESVINETNIRILQDKCFEYYRDLVSAKGATPQKFEHFAGNSMLWHGHTLHRGDRHNGGMRHSLTVHFVAK